MKISTGIIKEPHFVLIYSGDGAGKTTFAAEAPKSIIVGPESGSKRINVARAQGIRTMKDVRNAITWLRNEKHDYKSVGIDSLDWIEPLLWAEVAAADKKESIEDVGGGFQKGYAFALDHWRSFIAQLQDLRANRDMNIITIAHAQVKTVNDPTQLAPYDRYTLKLQDGKTTSAAALWREAVEAVLFIRFEDTIFKIKEKDQKAKATGEGKRVLCTVRHAAWDAKNRLGLPPELPFEKGSAWKTFSEAADASDPDSAEAILSELRGVYSQLKEKDSVSADKIAAAIGVAQGDIEKLKALRENARVLV